MIDLILQNLPHYFCIGFILAILFIFSLPPERDSFGLGHLVLALVIIFGWLLLVIVIAVIAIRDFFFDNLERLCVDDQDQDGDDQ